jgi:hypothetical protein
MAMVQGDIRCPDAASILLPGRLLAESVTHQSPVYQITGAEHGNGITAADAVAVPVYIGGIGIKITVGGFDEVWIGKIMIPYGVLISGFLARLCLATPGDLVRFTGRQKDSGNHEWCCQQAA